MNKSNCLFNEQKKKRKEGRKKEEEERIACRKKEKVKEKVKKPEFVKNHQNHVLCLF